MRNPEACGSALCSGAAGEHVRAAGAGSRSGTGKVASCAAAARARDRNLSDGAMRDAMKAKINFLPMQMGDVKETYANTLELENWINYKPKTLIKNGVSQFINWYLKFYKISIKN